MTDLNTLLDQASAAAKAKAWAIWERDEKQDRGSCGGAMFLLKKSTKLYKAAVAKGYACAEGYINHDAMIPPGIRSQNADIPQGAAREFKRVIEDAGLGFAIAKFWTYID